jgi:hypothetical protein
LTREFDQATTGAGHAADDVADDGQAGQAAVGPGEGVELAAQSAARPEQQRFNGSDTDVEMARDAVV